MRGGIVAVQLRFSQGMTRAYREASRSAAAGTKCILRPFVSAKRT